MFFTDSYKALRRGERRRALTLAMLSVLIIALIGLPVGYFALRRFEASVTFHPERAPWGGGWRVPRGGEDVWFETADGSRLHGWFVSSPTRPPAATVVYFHGNGGNISYVDWVGEQLAARGFDVLLFDYRGYGRSEGALSDERGVYEDADAAYDFVVRERGARPESVVLYGQSLGTTAAADVAARRPCGALVLESGLSSAAEMARTILPWLPRFAARATRNKFDTLGKLPRVGCPVLVAHGDRDAVIPVEQGRALHAAAPEPKRLLVVPGAGHNDLTIVGGAKYMDAVADFIKGL
ncbi:MAG TPA: alpha/beta fold hydrolase [Pyrinomonadaceae bacterium]|nr:alpha/beta fold hydrolase [Pyrinomonadaceae bacterium]